MPFFLSCNIVNTSVMRPLYDKHILHLTVIFGLWLWCFPPPPILFQIVCSSIHCSVFIDPAILSPCASDYVLRIQTFQNYLITWVICLYIQMYADKIFCFCPCFWYTIFFFVPLVLVLSLPGARGPCRFHLWWQHGALSHCRSVRSRACHCGVPCVGRLGAGWVPCRHVPGASLMDVPGPESQDSPRLPYYRWFSIRLVVSMFYIFSRCGAG